MDPDCYPGGARLLADIGRTNARFALAREPGRIEHATILACASYPRFVDAMRDYLDRYSEPRHAYS